jgi:hypothetical protein
MTVTMPKTDLMPRPRPNRAAEPDDHCESWSLTHVVEAAVRNVDGHSLRPLRASDAGHSDSKRMLALLSWSYARQLYSSAAIHARLRAAPVAGLWEGETPEEEDIRRFRDENRHALEYCLRTVLVFLAAQKVAEGLVTWINESHLAAEASRRIIVAMFIDSTEAADRRPADEMR